MLCSGEYLPRKFEFADSIFAGSEISYVGTVYFLTGRAWRERKSRGRELAVFFFFFFVF